MEPILLKISSLRVKKGLGRGQVASAIGVNTNTYTKMEKGMYVINVSRLYGIAEALQVNCDALLDNDDPEADYLEEQYKKVMERLRKCQQMIITEQGKLIELHEKLK